MVVTCPPIYLCFAGSKANIHGFVEQHAINTDELLLPLDQYNTFNEFFFRRLKPDARPIDGMDNLSVAVSPADCRMVRPSRFYVWMRVPSVPTCVRVPSSSACLPVRCRRAGPPWLTPLMFGSRDRTSPFKTCVALAKTWPPCLRRAPSASRGLHLRTTTAGTSLSLALLAP